MIQVNRRTKVIVFGLLLLLGAACAKPEDTPPPERRTNTISIAVDIPTGQPIVTFTVKLELKNAITGEYLHHPITNEISKIQVTRSTRRWEGTFTYWGDEAPVRLTGEVTWPDKGELLRVTVKDNRKVIPEAGRFDDTGRIVILYTTSGA